MAGDDELYVSVFVTDHAGTPRELIDQDGQCIWRAAPDDWGAVTREKGIRQPLRFQRQYFDEESRFYYNRWRYYDPRQGRYITQDPIGLAGGLNGYVYPTDPVGGGDPLGLRIIFAQGSTSGQIAEFRQAITYLKNSPTAANLINQMEQSTTDYTITFWSQLNGRCNRRTKNIFWNSRLSVTCTGNNASSGLSPSMVLLHEINHCLNGNSSLARTPDPSYDNAEEHQVIMGSEKTVASELNSTLKTKEGQRYNHGGVPVVVSSPTTVIWHSFFGR
jgi:RHS repeat-associated protein